ncbi:MAG TPA: DUF6600 domain-containing protein [Rhodanobacter sp.]|nr:DUF6600 domain-containing protein [Rhodanobacter sp.]
MRTWTKLLVSLRHHGVVLVIALLCAGTGLARAQTTAGDDSADPPSRVARLSWLAGDIGFLPAGAKDWSDADINRPLTTGDRLSSSRNGRAELEFGGGTLRIDNDTDLGLLDLNEQLAQIELSQGTLSLSVRHLDDGQSYEIDTPTVALVIDQPGSYRVDINDDDGSSSTRVTVFNGDAVVYGENHAERDVHAGRSYRFVDSGLSAVAITDIGAGDNFDAWVNQREQRYAQEASDPYVPDDMVGTPDLREYGAWENSSDYGAVWYPNDVSADWAPYRNGHWAYIAPWGWTWIDAAPWGYAPYHYGRWAHTHRGWGWIPGPRYARPIYAPALVVFVGGGLSAGIGSGPVGWFPLGPGEIYNPWYRCNQRCYTRINATNIRVGRRHDQRSIDNDINNHYAHYRDNRPLQGERYANRYAPRGITAMSGHDFAAGQRVQRHRLRDDKQLATAAVRPHGADLRPIPVNLAAARSAHTRNLPLNGFRRDVVARHAPPQAVVEHGLGTGNRMNEAARMTLPVSHVRVLSQADRHPEAGVRARPVPRGRGSELPSARFAHPVGNHVSERDERQPRPEVSYISPDNRPRPENNPPSARLPQVPRIERAEPVERGMPAHRFAPREIERGGSPAMRSTGTESRGFEPRFQQAEPERRNPAVQALRPMPSRSEAPRQTMQQPRYVPAQRSTTPVRAEAPPPRRSSPPPERKAESHRDEIKGHRRD